MKRCIVLIAISFLVAPLESATASLGPPVLSRILGPARFARDQVPFQGTMRINARTAVQLSSFHFAGPGWVTNSISVPSTIGLGADDSLDISFEVVPEHADSLLDFVFNVGDAQLSYELRTRLSLSFHTYLMTTDLGLVSILEGQSTPLPAPGGQTSSPVHDDTPTRSTQSPAQTIHITGRLVYSRRENASSTTILEIGCDGATVELRDDDTIGSDLIGSSTTDSDGNFDFTASWSGSEDPDIYLRFYSRNSHVDVQQFVWDDTYTFTTDVSTNFTGSSKDYGTLAPIVDEAQPCLHILTSMTRIYRWYSNLGWSNPPVNVKWPYYNWIFAQANFYWAPTSTIHISEDDEWEENTHAHEYGHHFLQSWAWQPNLPWYLPGSCFPSHCTWCEESAEVAWSEGFPDWVGCAIPASFKADYGIAAYDDGNCEDLRSCVDANGNPCNCNPAETEGYVALLLNDIEDSPADDHDNDGIADAMNSDPYYILIAVGNANPHGVTDFIDEWTSTILGCNPLWWATARNCGFELDLYSPDPPTLSGCSTTHSISVPSANPTIEFEWNLPSDDCANVSGFSVLLSSGGPSSPDYTVDIATPRYTTGVLAPGTYYLNVRSVDQAGHWSTSVSDGPYIVRNPIPANLAFDDRPLWTASVVPRNVPGGTDPNHVPVSLSTSGTYWNVAFWNSGDSTASGAMRFDLDIDGVNVAREPSGLLWTLAPLEHGTMINKGPVTIIPGLHTFGVRVDGTDVIAEASEGDNVQAHQWTWDPENLVAGAAAVTRPAPPDPTGGWDWIVDGSSKRYNCYGFTASTQGGWNAITLYSLSTASDYDCRLHQYAAGISDDAGAFGPNLAWARRNKGQLDVIFVEQPWATVSQYDVGVLNGIGTQYSDAFRLAHVVSDTLTLGSLVAFNLTASQMAYLGTLVVTAPITDGVSVTIAIGAGDEPVHAFWIYDDAINGVQRSVLDDYDFISTDASGQAVVETNSLLPGNHCLVVFRESASVVVQDYDGITSGGARELVDPQSGSTSVTVQVNRRTPNVSFLPAVTGWYAPLVPRPSFDGIPSNVALPDSLLGNASSTYLNLAAQNSSPARAESLQASVSIDGTLQATLFLGSLAPSASLLVNWPSPINVRGGRHTLSVLLDDRNRPNIHQDDNRRGEQFLWSPLVLTPGFPVNRPMPPSLGGGWDDNIVDDVVRYNCDGLRLPVLAGAWRAVSVVPGQGSNVDLKLHEALRGAKNGFDDLLAFSAWGAGEGDFVLVNTHLTTSRRFDTGILSSSSTSAPYTAETIGSTFRGSNPHGTFGPFSLGTNSALALHEFNLDPADYTVTVDNVSGFADLGVSLHPADLPYLSKSIVVPGGASWLNGPGVNESFTVRVTTSGFYCLAVWKRGRSDLPVGASYRLIITRDVSSAEEPDAPPLTRIEAAYPSPFRESTTIALAVSRESNIKIHVYDVEGTRVRVLLEGRLAAGQHTVSWDGRDDLGGRVRSGVYIVRVTTGSHSEGRKVVLLN